MPRNPAGQPTPTGQDRRNRQVNGEARDHRPGPPRFRPNLLAGNCAATLMSAPILARCHPGVDSSNRSQGGAWDQGKAIAGGEHLETGRASRARVLPIRASFQTGLGRCSIATRLEGGTNRRSGVSARLAGPWKQKGRQQRIRRSPVWPRAHLRRRQPWSVSNCRVMPKRARRNAHTEGPCEIERA